MLRLTPLVCQPDPRNPLFITHSVTYILRAGILAIACGYEDGNDLDDVRSDPIVDVLHGHQQLSLLNAHYDDRCFLPIHVYDTAIARPVAFLLRPGRTPTGEEISQHLRRLVRRIRMHWPNTLLTIRGDGHYGRPEVMAWCGANKVRYILGLPRNKVLHRLVAEAADDVCVRRAEAQKPVLRRYTELRHGAKSWKCTRRVSARNEASTQGLDIRYVVTNLAEGSAEWLYDVLYCARARAENLIKSHKSQLASDRTSCRAPLANQVRLVLHTAAYWLMLTVRDMIHKTHVLAAKNCRTGHGNRDTRAPGLRRVLPRLRTAHRYCARPAASRAVTERAMCPEIPHNLQPSRRSRKSNQKLRRKHAQDDYVRRLRDTSNVRPVTKTG